MSSEKPQAVHRVDYRSPDYYIDTVDLDFSLGEDETIVRARLGLRRNPSLQGDAPPLILHGEELELLEIAIDGQPLEDGRWLVTEAGLTVDPVPARFELETVTRIKPQENTALSGLYLVTYLEQRAANEMKRAEDLLVD